MSFPIGSVVEAFVGSDAEVVSSGFASLDVVAEAIAPDVFPCIVSREVAS
jgi:hypothetical protein